MDEEREKHNEKDMQIPEDLHFWVKHGMKFVYLNLALFLFFIALYILQALTAREAPSKLLYLLLCAMSGAFAVLFYYNYKKAKAEIAKYRKSPDT